MQRVFRFAFLGLTATVGLFSMTALGAPAIAQSPGILDDLDLTEAQQETIEEIFDDRRADVEAVLTEEQLDQFQTTLEDTEDFREAVQSIDNFTDAQKTDVRGIVQTSRDEIADVLTDEQQETLRSMMEERRGGRRRR